MSTQTDFQNIALLELTIKTAAIAKMSSVFQKSQNKAKQKVGKDIEGAANTLQQAVKDLQAIITPPSPKPPKPPGPPHE